MKQFVFVLFFFLLSVQGFSTKIDSLIFDSSFEQNLFERLIDSGKIDPLKFFTAIDYSEENYGKIVSEVDRMVNALEAKKIGKKSLKSKVKMIYKEVHSTLLKHYEENVVFNEIIKSGDYNCVTASSLYAIMLDKFELDYSIKEKPNHIYLIVDPGDKGIIMESTNPRRGVYIYDDITKKSYVAFLYDNKIISKEEYEANPANELFNKYFYKDKVIGMQQLIGLHYYNRGVIYVNDNNFKEANRCFEKAMLLYPESDIIRFNYYYSLEQEIQNQSDKESYDGRILAKFVNLNYENTESVRRYNSIFGIITDRILIKNSDIEAYNIFFNDLKKYVDDSVDISDLTFTFNYFSAYYYLIQADYYKSIDYAELAYDYNPNNLHIKAIVHDDVAKLLYRFEYDDLTLDTLQIFLDKFPFLLDYDFFNNAYGAGIINTMTAVFEKNNESQILNFISKFDSLMNNENKINDRDRLIEGAYRLVYSHYNAKNDYDKIIELFTEALILYPDNEYLKLRIEFAEMMKKNNHRRNTNPDRYEGSPVYTQPAAPAAPLSSKDYLEMFKKRFPGCWQASSFRKPKSKVETKLNSTRKITVKSKRIVEYIYKGKKLKGKWSIREKSKLLYFTPENDKANYLVFKIIKIEKDYMELRPYEGKRLTNEILIFRKCP